jgi:hypothetical protein
MNKAGGGRVSASSCAVLVHRAVTRFEKDSAYIERQCQTSAKLGVGRLTMELIEVLFRAIGVLLGLPLRLFRRWLDRQPHCDPSHISTLQRVGRLALGTFVSLLILTPLAWLVLK